MSTVFLDSILTALIAAAASVVTAIIAKHPSRKNIAAVQKLQLDNVYVPLEMLLQKNISTDEKLKAAKIIVSEQYLIFPPAIKHKIDSLSADSNPDLEELSTMVHSYFEWTKRSLGYPCDEWAIVLKYTPITGKYTIWVCRLSLIVAFLWLVSGSIFITAVFEGNNPFGLSETWLIGLGTVFVFGLSLLITISAVAISIGFVKFVLKRIKNSRIGLKLNKQRPRK